MAGISRQGVLLDLPIVGRQSLITDDSLQIVSDSSKFRNFVKNKSAAVVIHRLFG